METHSCIAAPRQNGEKMINLTSKMEEINDIEHNKGSKIYPQNQLILVCIMSSIPLKHKFCFFLLFLIGKNRHGIGIRWLFSIGNWRRAEHPCN